MSKGNKNKKPGYLGYLLKLAIFALCLVGLLFCLYLIINKDGKKVPTWRKVKEIPRVNLFKFFGVKWNLIFLIVLFIAGLLYKWPVFELLARRQERKRFIEFCQGVHMAMVSADVGKGKTLLLSILAREMPHGIKKVGFVSNVPDAQLISYDDINFDLPIPKKESYRIPKYFFLDEVNFIIEGVNFRENQLYHKGVAWFLQILRHHRVRAWMSATRDNHVWVQVRQMANYYVKLGGLKPLMNAFGYEFYTQRIRFYSQEWELQEEFNIEINNLDFELYDSYWLKDTSYFRPTLESLAEKGQLEREKKIKEREDEIKKKKQINSNPKKKYQSWEEYLEKYAAANSTQPLPKEEKEDHPQVTNKPTFDYQNGYREKKYKKKKSKGGRKNPFREFIENNIK